MASRDGCVRINITNGLLLYYHHYSFYSQKVVMALYEKNVPFDSHIVNLVKGAQYEPWFLELNPRGEVPVLQDTGKIIPDSARIIDYLEDNFSNGETPRLIPLDQGQEIRQKVINFRNLIDELPAGIITKGSFFHPELVRKPRIPFIGPVRRLLANAEKNSSKVLRHHAENNPCNKSILLEKAAFQEKKFVTVTDKTEFLQLLEKVEVVLNKVEEELASHTENKQNWWLCTDRFTIADIALTIFLERLSQLGFEYRFWLNGIRPNLEKYYERVKLRESYKKTVPSTFFFLKMLLSENPLLMGVSVATTVAVILGGVYFLKKLIY